VLKTFNKVLESKDKKIFKRHYCNLFISTTLAWCGGGGSGDGLGNLMMFEGERLIKGIMKLLGEAIFWGRIEENCGFGGREMVDTIVGRGGIGGMGMMPPRPNGMGGGMGGGNMLPRPPVDVAAGVKGLSFGAGESF